MAGVAFRTRVAGAGSRGLSGEWWAVRTDFSSYGDDAASAFGGALSAGRLFAIGLFGTGTTLGLNDEAGVQGRADCA